MRVIRAVEASKVGSRRASPVAEVTQTLVVQPEACLGTLTPKRRMQYSSIKALVSKPANALKGKYGRHGLHRIVITCPASLEVLP